MDDIIENEFGLIPNQDEEINIIDETFEEFATYLLQNCQHEYLGALTSHAKALPPCAISH
jgi:hypothetical protein